MKNTGERIKALLNEKKMTQRQLAELSGVTESALSHYIKGDRIPSGVASVNIAYALSTTVNYILGNCPVCGATWKRKTRCKLVRDSDLFYCKRCEVELKVRVIGGK